MTAAGSSARTLALPVAGAIFLAAALGAGVAVSPVAPVALTALLASVLLTSVAADGGARGRGLLVCAALLIAATFVTRFRYEVAGFGFRIEHAALVFVVLVVLQTGRLRTAVRIATRPYFVALGVYVVWLAIVSVFFAPAPASSLAIVGWLAMDWVMAVAIASAFVDRVGSLERIGLWAAMCAFAIALGLWFIGGFGLQTEYVTGQRSLYGLSYESNLLGSTAAIWILLAMTGRSHPTWVRYMVAAAGSIVLLLSYTRAAVLALAVGLVVVAVGQRRLRRQVVRAAVPLLVVLASAIAVTPSTFAPVIDKLSQVGAVNESTGARRTGAVEIARSDLAEDPLKIVTGFGANTFGQRHFDPSRPGEQIPAYLPVFPVEVIYSGGLVSLGLLLFAFARLLPRERKARSLGVAAVFLVSSLATSPFWLGSTWLLIGWAAAARESRQRGA